MTSTAAHGERTLPRTIPGALRAIAASHGDHAAYVEDGVTLTFADLLAAVRETAAGYLTLGLEPGDRVCVWAPNSRHWAVAALAVSYAGGVLVPLNSRYTGHEAHEIAERVAARIVVLADGFLGRTQVADLRAAGDLPHLRALVVLPGDTDPDDTVRFDGLPHLGADVDPAEVEARADAVTPDDVADLLFTSGTTGRSKGVMTAHRQTIEAARVWGELGELSDADRYLMVNPFFHSFGYKAGIVVGLLFGTTLHPMSVYDPAALLTAIEQHRITVLTGAPTIFSGLLEAPERATTDLSSLRFAVTGATVVPVALIERMQSELGFDLVLTAFGMTECVTATMCRRGDDPRRIAATCGRVVPGLELRIADPETGEQRGPGEEGEVQLRGDLVMLGYLDDPEATAEAIDEDGWLHTGDVGKVDGQGYLTITDRLKDMFITGGFNVYPAEVEQTLARLEGVVESAVVGVPDERLGEVGRAFVVRREGADLDEHAVIAHCKERLANFKVPRSVVFVDALPRNLAGKVLKNELREGATS